MPTYDDQVFINCPFTPEYQPLFRAIVFAVQDCGFVPRCALETSDAAETRLDKIFRLIGDCRYAIHDISMAELDPVSGYPRFNMPLELGIFLGARRFGSARQKRKSCLILDREPYRFQQFCSDISGQDPQVHHGDPAKAIECVRNWLNGERPGVRFPGGKHMAARYARFTEALPLICDALRLDPDDLPFNDFTDAVEEWIRGNPR